MIGWNKYFFVFAINTHDMTTNGPKYAFISSQILPRRYKFRLLDMQKAFW